MKKQKMNTNLDVDRVFAQLTDLFGDTVPSAILLKTGTDNNWNCKILFYKNNKYLINFSLSYLNYFSERLC